VVQALCSISIASTSLELRWRYAGVTVQPTTELLVLVTYRSCTDRKKISSIIACSLFDGEASFCSVVP
jgi:hypothetical protein